MSEPLFTKRGGYRQLDTFMLATIIYYGTVTFCREHIKSHGKSNRWRKRDARAGRTSPKVPNGRRPPRRPR